MQVVSENYWPAKKRYCKMDLPPAPVRGWHLAEAKAENLLGGSEWNRKSRVEVLGMWGS